MLLGEGVVRERDRQTTSKNPASTCLVASPQTAGKLIGKSVHVPYVPSRPRTLSNLVSAQGGPRVSTSAAFLECQRQTSRTATSHTNHHITANMSSDEISRELSRLWRVLRTTKQMCADRVCARNTTAASLSHAHNMPRDTN